MNVESQGYVYEKNETGEGCLPGGKTHFCPQRQKSAPLTTVTKVSWFHGVLLPLKTEEHQN